MPTLRRQTWKVVAGKLLGEENEWMSWAQVGIQSVAGNQPGDSERASQWQQVRGRGKVQFDTSLWAVASCRAAASKHALVRPERRGPKGPRGPIA